MLTSTQTTILSALSAFMKGEHYQAPPETDWKALFKESVEQAVALSCLQGLDLSDMPIEVKQAWQNYAMRSLTSNVNVHEQHAYVHRLMMNMQIPYVIMKGCSAAYYYSDPLMRAMGDVDFWVPEENASTVVKKLKEEGWETDGKWEIHHIGFSKGKAELELHREPAGMPKGEIGKQIGWYFSDVFECAQEVELDGVIFRKPSDFHHGLILLMHMEHHLSNWGLGLRQFCDWAVFISKFSEEDFCKLFQEKLERVGLWKFTQIISYLCFLYFQTPYCKWMDKQDEIFCELILQAIFQGGNFGQKEDSVAVGTILLSENKSIVEKRGDLSLIKLANSAGRIKHPKLAKIPIIKHCLFIPMGFRYVWQKITGRRKGKGIGDAMQTAAAKEQVYKQFELFEVKKNEHKN